MRAVVFALVLGTSAALSPAQEMLDQQRRDQAQKHYQAGQEYMLSEAFEKAEVAFKSATDVDPNHVMAFYGLGQARMALKKYPEAVQAYTACRDLFLRQASLDQRSKQERDRRLRDEIQEIEQLLARVRSAGTTRQPGSSEGQLIALEQRRSVLRDQIGRDSGDAPRVPAEVSLGLGSAHFRLGQNQQAEQNYRAAIAVDGKMGAAHNNLAVIYMLSGRLDEAEREMKAAEKAGFTVSPKFKDDLKQRMSTKKS
jgi:tetratricopeptide (TPR) repeat protein